MNAVSLFIIVKKPTQFIFNLCNFPYSVYNNMVLAQDADNENACNCPVNTYPGHVPEVSVQTVQLEVQSVFRIEDATQVDRLLVSASWSMYYSIAFHNCIILDQLHKMINVISVQEEKSFTV